MSISAPEPLGPRHETAHFECGEPVLDNWLKRHALANQLSGVSRTFVIHDAQQVKGYYTLAAGSVARIDVPRRLRRNAPEPIPVIVLGRLAVDTRRQGHGLGIGLLKDALLRCAEIAVDIGVAGVLVHAISDTAKTFYLNSGFLESPTRPLTLVLPVAAIITEYGAPRTRNRSP